MLRFVECEEILAKLYSKIFIQNHKISNVSKKNYIVAEIYF